MIERYRQIEMKKEYRQQDIWRKKMPGFIEAERNASQQMERKLIVIENRMMRGDDGSQAAVRRRRESVGWAMD